MKKFLKSLTPSSKRRLESRVLQGALATLAGLILAALLVFWQTNKDEERNHDMQVKASAFSPDQPVPPQGDKIGGPFTLTNQDRKTVHDTDFRGKYLLVYFGYTYCPDMCPTGLQGIAHVLDQLGPDADKVVPLFITFDPSRDTPEKLKEYSASFHPRIISLTGTEQEIAAVAKSYQVYYAKAEQVDDKDYIMEHSSLIYVMNQEGHFITTFDENVDPAKIVSTLRNAWTKPESEKSQGPGY